MVVAIDGPAGSGKSTVSKILARKLGFMYLDTGAIYRALAYVALKKKIPLDDGKLLAELAKTMQIEFKQDEQGQRVIVNGEDVSEKIRTEEVGMAASKVSMHPEVREALLGIQRDFGEKGNLVAEGRDMGTVVFPNAEVKVFLTASPEVRAQRRYLELKEKGINTTLEEVLKSVIERDRQDSTRSVAPLKPASDAVIIDTSNMSIEEVVNSIMRLVELWKKEKHTSS